MNYLVVFLTIAITTISGQLNGHQQNEAETSFISASSYNSLISSQCKTRCLSLYPWRLHHASALSSSRHSSSSLHHLHRHRRHQVRWAKVQESCSKNTNCIMCTMPCDIPTDLLSSCKMMCRDQHPMCLESCDLMSANKRDLTSGPVQLNNTNTEKSSEESSLLAALPHNLQIKERKKGRTVKLSWSMPEKHNNNKKNNKKDEPIMFLVESRWSMEIDTPLTKWGYLAQTTNNLNWIILRNINRGRWYTFRVAAISPQGSRGYSPPTDLFILSTPPKPPTTPQNLTIDRIYQAQQQNSIQADVSWLLPRRSDLPIKSYKISWHSTSSTASPSQDNGYHADSAIINKAHNLNSYTLRGLRPNSVYTVRVVAVSVYDSRELQSQPALLVNLLDTSLIISPIQPHFDALVSPSSSSLTGAETAAINQGSSEEETEEDYNLDDYENEEEEEDVDSQYPNNRQFVRNSPIQLVQQHQQQQQQQNPKGPVIRNLTVGKAFYQRGLVKAALSWSVDNQNNNDQEDQLTSYTISWFGLHCADGSEPPAQIKATTIATKFIIYELGFSCDYIVNVQLDTGRLKPLSEWTNQQQKQQQQEVSKVISSAKFRVPDCSSIQVIDKMKPICNTNTNININTNTNTDSKNFEQNNNTKKSTSEETEMKQQNKPQQNFVYDLNMDDKLIDDFNSWRSDQLTSSSSSTTNKPSILPRIDSIRYKVQPSTTIQSRRRRRMGYAVKFSWSLLDELNLDDHDEFTGYQISVVPKALPRDDPNNFGSVGAIVLKAQSSFVVRNLRAYTPYIFQILPLGNSHEYGEAKQLEFRIDSRQVKLMQQQQEPATTKERYNILASNTADDEDNNENDNGNEDPRTALRNLLLPSSSSSSASSYLQSSNALATLVLGAALAIRRFSSF